MRREGAGRHVVRTLAGIYFSRQFVLYGFVGLLSTAAQIVCRWLLNRHMEFSAAVVFSYFVGMLVAFLLYRTFVFNSRGSVIPREMTFFLIAYFALFPVTWGLSVLAERPLLSVLEPDRAQLLAHLVGVAVPVPINFAYNKFITFKKWTR